MLDVRDTWLGGSRRWVSMLRGLFRRELTSSARVVALSRRLLPRPGSRTAMVSNFAAGCRAEVVSNVLRDAAATRPPPAA